MRHGALESRCEQADVACTGIARKFFQCLVANTSFRRGNGANEGRIVIRVCNQAQIGSEILDFRAIEEGAAATDGIGYFLSTQLFLKST